jgi:anti-sigma-K factor RskA
MSGQGETGTEHEGTALVAEYALGLLEGGERAAFARRLADDPALAAELIEWRRRFAGFDSDYAEVEPPGEALAAIERRLWGEAPAQSPLGFWQSLALWRGLAAASIVFACLSLGLEILQPRPLAPEQFATQLVAALAAQEGSGVEFVALYDQATDTVRITSVRGSAIPDRDYELWFIKGSEAPISMGVIPVEQRAEIPMARLGRDDFDAGTVLAVTLEPKGGSPTGVATGPIVAIGPAVSI